MLYIPEKGLPPALHNRLFRIAAFPNPEFYKAQAMHLSTYGKPPIISCADKHLQHIALPRGCLDNIRQLMGELDVSLKIENKRSCGKPIKASFTGKLRKTQRTAVTSIRSHDIGILSAATAFGKMPISWKGTLQQYAGRLHRKYDSKKEVLIYDYVDENIPMLQRIYKKRLTGYKVIGYEVKELTPVGDWYHFET